MFCRACFFSVSTANCASLSKLFALLRSAPTLLMEFCNFSFASAFCSLFCLLSLASFRGDMRIRARFLAFRRPAHAR